MNSQYSYTSTQYKQINGQVIRKDVRVCNTVGKEVITRIENGKKRSTTRRLSPGEITRIVASRRVTRRTGRTLKNGLA